MAIHVHVEATDTAKILVQHGFGESIPMLSLGLNISIPLNDLLATLAGVAKETKGKKVSNAGTERNGARNGVANETKGNERNEGQETKGTKAGTKVSDRWRPLWPLAGPHAGNQIADRKNVRFAEDLGQDMYAAADAQGAQAAQVAQGAQVARVAQEAEAGRWLRAQEMETDNGWVAAGAKDGSLWTKCRKCTAQGKRMAMWHLRDIRCLREHPVREYEPPRPARPARPGGKQTVREEAQASPPGPEASAHTSVSKPELEMGMTVAEAGNATSCFRPPVAMGAPLPVDPYAPVFKGAPLPVDPSVPDWEAEMRMMTAEKKEAEKRRKEKKVAGKLIEERKESEKPGEEREQRSDCDSAQGWSDETSPPVQLALTAPSAAATPPVSPEPPSQCRLAMPPVSPEPPSQAAATASPAVSPLLKLRLYSVC